MKTYHKIYLLTDLIVEHFFKVRNMPLFISGIASEPTHDVIVNPAQVHHVEGVEVHLQPPLLPVSRLLPPGLKAEHRHQQTRLWELGSFGVTAEL